jgi:hypothetical protein
MQSPIGLVLFSNHHDEAGRDDYACNDNNDRPYEHVTHDTSLKFIKISSSSEDEHSHNACCSLNSTPLKMPCLHKVRKNEKISPDIDESLKL